MRLGLAGPELDRSAVAALGELELTGQPSRHGQVEDVVVDARLLSYCNPKFINRLVVPVKRIVLDEEREKV